MDIKEVVKKELMEDEEILWIGYSKDFALINDESKKNIIVAITVNTFLFIALTIVVCLSSVGFSPVFELCCAGFFFLLGYLPVRDRKDVKECTYYLTDKRVITCTRKGLVLCLPRNNTKFKKVESVNGGTHLVFGGLCDFNVEKLLMKTHNPIVVEGIPEGLCFYNIDYDDKLKSLI